MKKTLGILLSVLMVFSSLACAAKTAVPATEPAVETAEAATVEPAAESAPEAAAFDPNMVIEFHDDVLEAIIHNALGKPDGDILVSDAL